MWIDAHNHLQDEALADTPRGLSALPVLAVVVNGTREDDWPRVQELAERYPWIHPAFGLHPWHVEGRSSEWKPKLEHFLKTPGSSIGEIGLDLARKNIDPVAAEEAFRWQLALAAERNLPASIHCVKAFGPLTSVLQSSPLPTCGFLLHAYSGSIEIARECVSLGAYFSFSGSFLHERAARRREVFGGLPLHRLLVETDAPNASLPNHLEKFSSQNGINHPGNVVACYEGLAKLRGMAVADLAEAVSQNFHRLFGSTDTEQTPSPGQAE
ncbi:MAG TPA: TatD family hydrolase [Chthoniobacterales bacterium]|jgi:TatD DNase family protein